MKVALYPQFSSPHGTRALAFSGHHEFLAIALQVDVEAA